MGAQPISAFALELCAQALGSTCDCKTLARLNARALGARWLAQGWNH